MAFAVDNGADRARRSARAASQVPGHYERMENGGDSPEPQPRAKRAKSAATRTISTRRTRVDAAALADTATQSASRLGGSVGEAEDEEALFKAAAKPVNGGRKRPHVSSRQAAGKPSGRRAILVAIVVAIVGCASHSLPLLYLLAADNSDVLAGAHDPTVLAFQPQGSCFGGNR